MHIMKAHTKDMIHKYHHGPRGRRHAAAWEGCGLIAVAGGRPGDDGHAPHGRAARRPVRHEQPPLRRVGNRPKDSTYNAPRSVAGCAHLLHAGRHGGVHGPAEGGHGALKGVQHRPPPHLRTHVARRVPYTQPRDEGRLAAAETTHELLAALRREGRGRGRQVATASGVRPRVCVSSGGPGFLGAVPLTPSAVSAQGEAGHVGRAQAPHELVTHHHHVAREVEVHR